MVPVQMAIRIYHGPNLSVPFPAVIAELSPSFPFMLPGHAIASSLKSLFPFVAHLPLSLPPDNTDLPELIARLAIAWQPSAKEAGLSACITRHANGTSHVAVGFVSHEMGLAALHAAVEMAVAVFCAHSKQNVELAG